MSNENKNEAVSQKIKKLIKKSRQDLAQKIHQKHAGMDKQQFKELVSIIEHRGFGPTSRNYPGQKIPSGVIPDGVIALNWESQLSIKCP